MPVEIKRYRGSKEYARAEVAIEIAGERVDPTEYDVDMAFTRSGEPESGDWTAAEWEAVDITTNPPTYRCRILTGPSTTWNLKTGRWLVWIRIASVPELVVVSPGAIVVK